MSISPIPGFNSRPVQNAFQSVSATAGDNTEQLQFEQFGEMGDGNNVWSNDSHNIAGWAIGGLAALAATITLWVRNKGKTSDSVSTSEAKTSTSNDSVTNAQNAAPQGVSGVELAGDIGSEQNSLRIIPLSDHIKLDLIGGDLESARLAYMLPLHEVGDSKESRLILRAVYSEDSSGLPTAAELAERSDYSDLITFNMRQLDDNRLEIYDMSLGMEAYFHGGSDRVTLYEELSTLIYRLMEQYSEMHIEVNGITDPILLEALRDLHGDEGEWFKWNHEELPEKYQTALSEIPADMSEDEFTAYCEKHELSGGEFMRYAAERRLREAYDSILYQGPHKKAPGNAAGMTHGGKNFGPYAMDDSNLHIDAHMATVIKENYGLDHRDLIRLHLPPKRELV